MKKENQEESPKFDTIKEAFEYFLSEVYPEIPAQIKKENRLSETKYEYGKGMVSSKRMTRLLNKFGQVKIVYLKK